MIEAFIKETPAVPVDYVFKSRKGYNMPITRQQAYRILNSAAEDLGLVERNSAGVIVSGEIGTHTMRKTFGYHAYKNGVSLELLMDIVNHSTPAMTLRYIGITEQKKKDVYLQFNLG
jgi:integrase